MMNVTYESHDKLVTESGKWTIVHVYTTCHTCYTVDVVYDEKFDFL